MTIEAEIVFDDRIQSWRVDLYKYEAGEWVLDRELGTMPTKSGAREAAEYAVPRGGSVYLENKSGDLERRYPV